MRWMFKCIFLIATGILLTLQLSVAQISQPYRYEVELDVYDNTFNVVNGEEKGVMLFRDINDYDEDNNPIYDFRILNTKLEPIWEFTTGVDRYNDLVGHDYMDGKYYILWRNTRGNQRDFRLWSINIEDGVKYEYSITNLVRFDVTEFEMTREAALIGGYYNLNPLVVFYDLSKKKSKVLPGIYARRAELNHIKVDKDKSSFIVVVSEKTFDKSNTLAVKMYNSNGEMVENTVLEPEFKRGLIYGRVADFDQDINLMIGTYSSKRSSYSRGVFIATIDDFGEQNIRYINYADFQNFFNYMRAKKKARVQERIERKKVKGKKIKFHYRLLVHEIITTGDQYLMIGEAFYPRYTSASTASQFRYYSTIPDATNSTYFDGYRYTHAVVVGFDKEGNLLWDNSFQIEDVVSYQLEQYVHAKVLDNNRTVLLYLFENEIRTKIIKGNEVIEGESQEELKLTYSEDESRDSNYESSILEKWYDGNFYAHGTQRIRNAANSSVKLNRKVFYINKITYL